MILGGFTVNLFVIRPAIFILAITSLV